jgi:hypothetical protein
MVAALLTLDLLGVSEKTLTKLLRVLTARLLDLASAWLGLVPFSLFVHLLAMLMSRPASTLFSTLCLLRVGLTFGLLAWKSRTKASGIAHITN